MKEFNVGDKVQYSEDQAVGAWVIEKFTDETKSAALIKMNGIRLKVLTEALTPYENRELTEVVIDEEKWKEIEEQVIRKTADRASESEDIGKGLVLGMMAAITLSDVRDSLFGIEDESDE